MRLSLGVGFVTTRSSVTVARAVTETTDDVSEMADDCVPIVSGRFLMPVAEADELHVEGIRDLFVVIRITDHHHSPRIVARRAQPRLDNVRLGRRVCIGDAVSLREVIIQGVWGQLLFQDLLGGCRDQDLLEVEMPHGRQRCARTRMQ